jgi:TolB-like protein
MKRLVIASIPLLTLALFSCSGKEVAKDPTTNSSYYQEKLAKLADELAEKAVRRPRKVVILDFVNTNGKTSQFGRYITSKFTEIAVIKKLFVTPAEGEVSKTIKQLNLAYNGTLDSVSVKKLGDALNADGVVVGIISDLQKGGDVDLVLKLLDTKTGNVVSAASTNFFRSKQVSTMLENF